jgi:hypothetical protein
MRRLALLSIVFAASCGVFRRDEFHEAQQLVDALSQRYQEITRLTIHAAPEGESECRVIASTDPVRRGTSSDPEDKQAIASGEIVVLDEPGAVDVTVPILPLDGKFTAAVGVTLRQPEGRDKAATVARAKEIAKAVADAAQRQPVPLW